MTTRDVAMADPVADDDWTRLLAALIVPSALVIWWILLVNH
jgi:hypothetical protein